MKNSNLLNYIKRQLLSKTSPDRRPELLNQLAVAFAELGASEVWESRLAPLLAEAITEEA